MRDLLRGVALGAVALALLGAIAGRAGWAELAVPRPDSTAPWLVVRATGFTAFVALALEVTVGLLVSTRAIDRWLPRGQTIAIHGWLSPIALALVLGHAALLLADGYLRFDLVDVVVPFAAPYRRLALGAGITAGYLALVVHASFALRRRLGTVTWRRLHYLSFAGFVAATLHGIAAGSDSGRPWAIAVYATAVAGVAALVAQRVVGALRRAPGLR